MERFVLIVAGGKGLRMGGDLPKQFIPMRGKPILMHTVEAFYRWDPAARIILALPEEHQPYWKMLCKEIGCEVPHEVVNGGEARFFSVRSGLERLLEVYQELVGEDLSRGLVAVHDGVRPFVRPEVIEACFREAKRAGAVVPVVPMIDSLRQKDERGSRPVDRSLYMAVQTPQVFRLDLLAEAYRQPFSPLFTDDASVVEALGHPIATVAGDRENIKITTPFDLLIAEAMFGKDVE